MKTLTIISHTEHYIHPDGHVVGFGSTVMEINLLLKVFDKINHVAMLHPGTPPESSLPYTSNKVNFIALPALGGTRLKDKMSILLHSIKVLKIVRLSLERSDYFQFRAPTGIGVFVVPYLILCSSKKGWFKYAGNWKQEHPPLAYRFQRWLLKRQNKIVTINGNWPKQPEHCLTFENPCLTDDELIDGENLKLTKTINSNSITFCFVGRLEEEKGLGILIEAFTKLKPNEKKQIAEVNVVGQGKSLNHYKNLAVESGVNFVFHGFLSRQDVHNIYKKSHALILPSASEGFPKVVAEAMNYGCLPIVSNISSIGHYIKEDENGYLLNSITLDHLIEKIRVVLNIQKLKYSHMIRSNYTDLKSFTYAHYNLRIQRDVLDFEK